MTSRVRGPARRHRNLILAVAAALAGAPLLAGSAVADPAGTVTFTGGCGLLGSGLGAGSDPDPERVNVPAGTELRFVNRLGEPATLWLDREPAAQIPPGGTADVVFHDGPVLATMQISCLVSHPAGAMTVAVSPALTSQPSGQPSPSSGSPDGGGAGTSDRSAPGGSATGGSGSAEPATTRLRPGDAAPDRSAPGGSAPAGSGPAGSGSWPAGPAGPGIGAPPSGKDPVSRPPADPDGRSPRWGLATDPSERAGSSAGGAAAGDPPAADAEPATDRLAQTYPPGPGSNGPVGLLALVAAVCVVGVSAGAVRAIVAQRASRAIIG